MERKNVPVTLLGRFLRGLRDDFVVFSEGLFLDQVKKF
jgi:hypothetical protein